MAERDIDEVTGIETTGHEWDGIKELEQAAAALVAVDLLRQHRLGDRLLDRLIRPGRWLSGYTTGVLGYQPRAACGRRARGGRRPRKAALPRRRSPQRLARADRERSGAAAPSPWPAASAAFSVNCASATARRRRAARAIPTSTTTTGCGAARSRTSSRRSPTASAPDRSETRAPSQMPAFGRDEMLDGRRRSTTSTEYVLSLSGHGGRRGRRRRAAARSSPTTARPAMAPTARATQDLGAPNLTDAIWLYGGDSATIAEPDLQRPRRRDAGLGGAARSRRPSRRWRSTSTRLGGRPVGEAA